ncbi:hypothetical protein LINPERHAP1_LOCUS38520 [Linum perenne]
MWKMPRDKKSDDWMYNETEVLCRCGLKAARRINDYRNCYFSCPLEKEESCGLREEKEVVLVVEAAKREKDRIIREKDHIILAKQDEIDKLKMQLGNANVRLDYLHNNFQQWLNLSGGLPKVDD